MSESRTGAMSSRTALRGDRPRLSPGMVLDERFELLERLGAGSFGEVFRARQLVFGRSFREVALKLFFLDADDPGRVSDALRDAITLFELQEDNPDPVIARHLIQVFDVGVSPSSRRVYMSMRLVRGRRTLDDTLTRHGKEGLPVPLVLDYLRQLLLPLAWMHTLGRPAVHGDLKPDNVLLTPDWQVVLTDFGLAARMPRGTTGGAIAYQARETLLGRTGGPESDVFAVGVMWYQLLTGRHPFVSVSAVPEELVDAHCRAREWECRPARHAGDAERIVPVEEFHPAWREHSHLDRLLRQCLLPDPAMRPATARILLDRIENPLGLSGRPVWNDSATLREAPPKARRPAEQLTEVEALAELGSVAEALTRLNGMLEDRPNDVGGLLLKARLCLQTGDLAAAREACAGADKVSPSHPDVLRAMAAVYEAGGQATAAEVLRKRAAERERSPGRKQV